MKKKKIKKYNTQLIIILVCIFVVTGLAAMISIKREPQKVMAEGCVLQEGIKCLALDLHADRIKIYLENQLDQDIIIKNIKANSINSRCEVGSTALSFYKNKVGNFNLNCMPPLLNQPGKIRFDVIILYNSDVSPATEQHIGEIYASII